MQVDREAFFDKLDKLEIAAKSFDIQRIKAILKEIIPEYNG